MRSCHHLLGPAAIEIQEKQRDTRTMLSATPPVLGWRTGERMARDARTLACPWSVHALLGCVGVKTKGLRSGRNLMLGFFYFLLTIWMRCAFFFYLFILLLTLLSNQTFSSQKFSPTVVCSTILYETRSIFSHENQPQPATIYLPYSLSHIPV
jgi:hypothetical protein